MSIIKRLNSKNKISFIVECSHCSSSVLVTGDGNVCMRCHHSLGDAWYNACDEWENMDIMNKIKFLSEYELSNPDRKDVFDQDRIGVKYES